MKTPEYTAPCPEGMVEKAVEFKLGALPGGCVGLGDLAREMEKATEEHLGSYGMSRAELKAEGKIWVIGWTSIFVDRMPEPGEPLLLRLWPGKRKGVMYPRRYAFYTRNGEGLACASSLFLLMDEESRGLAAPTEKLKSIPVVVLPGEPELPPLQKPVPQAPAGKLTRTVGKAEIDLNGHMNNTHYLDWAEELAREEYSRAAAPRQAWVQYQQELLEGQTVELRHHFEGNSLFFGGSREGQDAFVVTMDYGD